MKHSFASILVLAFLGACAGRMPSAPADDASEVVPASPADAAPAANPPDAARARRDAATAGRAPDTLSPAPDVTFPEVNCPDNIMFCEDFEFGALNPARWTYGFWTFYYKTPFDIAIDFDTERPGHGKRSLRLRQLKPDDVDTRDAFIKTTMRFPLAGSRLFVRYYIYVDEPTPNRWFPVFFASDPARDPPKDYKKLFAVALLPQSETVPAPSTFLLNQDMDQPKFLQQRVPLAKWACWEIELRGDTKEMVVYVDGQPVSDGSITSSYAAATVQLSFGYANGHPDIIKHPGGFFNIWLDDIAVSKQRIGCTP